MSANSQPRAPRKALAAMYTSLEARPAGAKTYCWTGFIYDISTSGMRIELDDAVDGDTPIDCQITLPPIESRLNAGPDGPVTFRATGRVTRIHDDEPGPVRMGLKFDDFAAHTDRQTLEAYVGAGD